MGSLLGMRSFLRLFLALAFSISFISVVTPPPARAVDPLAVPTFTVTRGVNPNLARLNFTPDARARYQVRAYFSNDNYTQAYLMSNDYVAGTDLSNISNPSPTAPCGSAISSLMRISDNFSFSYCAWTGPNFRLTVRFSLVVVDRSTSEVLPESSKANPVGFLQELPTILNGTSSRSDGVEGLNTNTSSPVGVSKTVLAFRRSDDYSRIISYSPDIAPKISTPGFNISLTAGYYYKYDYKLFGGVVGNVTWFDSDYKTPVMQSYYVPRTPSPVVNIVATPSVDGGINVRWTNPTSGNMPASTMVYVSQDKYSYSRCLESLVMYPNNSVTLTAMSQGIINTPFVAGNKYYVLVRSSMSSPEGSSEVIWVSQPVTVQLPPGAPVATFTAADGSINATWTEPAYTGGITPTGYEIQASSDGTNWSNALFDGSSTSGTISGLTNGTSYSVRLRAKNEAGPGAWETSTMTPVGIPTAITQAVTSVGSTTAVIGMTLNARGDDVQVGMEYSLGYGTATAVSYGSTNSTSFVGSTNVTGLLPGKSYRVRAKARASDGTFYYGLWKSFTTTPLSVTNVSVTSTSTTATATWSTPVTDLFQMQYDVWAELDGQKIGSGCSALARSGNSGTCMIGGLSPGVLYDIRISATATGADYGNGTSPLTKNAIATKRLQVILDKTGLLPKLYAGMTNISLTSYFSADSGLPISVVSTTATKCLVETGLKLSVRASGTCSLTVSQAGNSIFGPAESKDVSLTVASTQTITFSFRSLTSPKVAATPIDISSYASASSGLSVAFASTTSEVCTIDGVILAPVSTGECEVIAIQSGNDSYLAAPQVTSSFFVVKGDQATLSITSLGGEFDQPLALQTSGGSGTGVVTYSISSAGNTSNCSKTATGVQAMQPGNCIVQAVKATDSNYMETYSSYKTLVFTKATQDITFVAIPDTIEGSTINPTVSSTSGLTVALQSLTTSVCTFSNGSISLDHAGTCRMKASQAGDTKYLAASDVTIQFESNSKATPQTGTMRYDRTRTYYIGDTIDFYVAEDVNGAQSEIPGTFTWLADTPGILEFDSQVPGRATVVGRPAYGMLNVMYRFTPSAGYAASYNPALGPAALQVARTSQPLSLAPQLVQYDEPAQFLVGGILGTGQLSYGFSPMDRNMQNAAARNAFCTISGTVVTRSEPGTCVVRAMIGTDIQYDATDAVQEFVFSKKAQTLSIENGWILDEANYATRSTTYDLSGMAVSSEELSVEVSTTSSSCSISSGVLTVLSAGQCSIKLAQAGTSTIEAVAEYFYTFNIGKAQQSAVTMSTTSTTFGVALSLSASGGDGNGALAFEAANGAASGCRITNGTLLSDTAGSCLVQVTKAESQNYATLVSSPEIVTIEKASHMLSFSFASLPTVRVGDSPFSISSFASLSSGQSASFVSGSPSICTVSGSVVTVRASGQCIIDADFSENISYTAISTVTRYFTVEGASTVVNESVSAPRNVSLIRGGSKALVASWQVPTSGQSTITTYVATLSPSGKRCSVSVTTCTFTGLDASKSYSVSVVAVSATMTSGSGLSSSVIPNIQMKPNGKTNLRTMITAPSKGAQKWSVKGGCKISGQMFIAAAKTATCTLTLATAKYKTTPKSTLKVSVQIKK